MTTTRTRLLGLAPVVALTASALGQTVIDFEGLGLAEGDAVPALGGVTFVADIAIEGGAAYGFGVDSLGNDIGNAPPFSNSGNVFITNPGGFASPETIKVITIEFPRPVAELSFLAADVDSLFSRGVYEQLTARVFDAGGDLLATEVFDAPRSGPNGDGDVVSIHFLGVVGIRSLVITNGLNPPTGDHLIGFGIDNLSFIEGPPDITIDATSLSLQGTSIYAVGSFPVGTPTAFSLDPGTYSFRGAQNAFVFEVTASGTLDFDVSLDGFLWGHGTHTLIVNGYDVTVDATALSPQNARVFGVSQAITTPLTLIPGTYGFQAGDNGFPIMVTNAGTVDYDAAFDGFVAGRGTDTLVLSGYDVTVDATALSPQNVRVFGVSQAITTPLTLIPGTYRVQAGDNGFLFMVTNAGTVDYDAAFDGFVAGRGTDTLVVSGFVLTIDATVLLPSHNTRLFGISQLVTDPYTLIPGTYNLRAGEFGFVFTLDGTGLAQNLPPTFLGFPVSGNGTSTIFIGVVNEPPTAVAGTGVPVHAGETIVLDGSASFDDNTASLDLLYTWSFAEVPAESTAVLTGATTVSPSFVADLPGTYKVQLVVTDEGGLSSDPGEVVISSTNLAPMANAGVDAGGVVGITTVLDGSGSDDPDEDLLGFSWSFEQRPAGSSATLLGAGADMPSFVPDVAGIYEIALVVNDGFADSAPDTVTITVITGEEFAENSTLQALDFVAGLPPSSVTTKGNQRALTNFLSQAIKALQAGDIEKALNKLGKAIGRTDGCVLRGAPDGNGPGRDWITDCGDQIVVYALLIAAEAAISP